jgi:hypothetical protein
MAPLSFSIESPANPHRQNDLAGNSSNSAGRSRSQRDAGFWRDSSSPAPTRRRRCVLYSGGSSMRPARRRPCLKRSFRFAGAREEVARVERPDADNASVDAPMASIRCVAATACAAPPAAVRWSVVVSVPEAGLRAACRSPLPSLMGKSLVQQANISRSGDRLRCGAAAVSTSGSSGDR